MIPNLVHDRLHIRGFAGDSHYRILLGHHDAELAHRSVTSVKIVPTTPELIAIALLPITLLVFGSKRHVGNLKRGSFLNPLFWQEPFAVPDAFLQVQLPE